ncbi:GATA transcription factor [Trema orientale]|uniref:GATA transcription factor n=1 Tax=Trema orientale TaxID=63057 RepID=A0A2P5DHI0_TREOI|nr:GATA transcription factor [Trema orientale]
MDFCWNVSISPPSSDLNGSSSGLDDLFSSQNTKPQKRPTSLEAFSVPSKARSKRKRALLTKKRDPLTIWSSHQTLQMAMTSDPPLLQQTYWLADSELIVPKNEEEREEKKGSVEEKEPLGELGLMGHGLLQPGPVARRCNHCLSQRTPQWRAGPLGPKTLCNACGVRYKSGRLLPEYRPAKSPTFVSYLHSNSHKKVMEMRNGS